MAGSPRFKVIDKDGTYVASCKQLDAAIYLLAGLYSGGKIRDANWNRIIVKDTGMDAWTLREAALRKHGEWVAEHKAAHPIT